MKILQIIQKPQRRGAEIFACQLSKELIKAGAEVHVAYLFDHPVELPPGLRYIPLHASASKRFWDWSAYRKLNKLIRQEKYDIVQANAGDTLKYAALSKTIYHWTAPLIFRNANKISHFINTRLKYVLNKFFLSKVDYVVSVSELCRTDFVNTFKSSNRKIETVQIGIDLVEVGTIPPDLAQVYLSGPVLVNVASMAEEKNHVGLLSIFERVLKVVPDAQLILIGKGKLEFQLKKWVSDRHLQNKIHFAGTRTDVLEIMKGSQALLMPSHVEGLPAVILEGQYCKIPVVAYNVGGISEVVRSNETGWLIEKGDEDKFAEDVVNILRGDLKLIEPILLKAKAEVHSKYDNKVIAYRFLNVFNKVKQ